jgi:hypothetical protein
VLTKAGVTTMRIDGSCNTTPIGLWIVWLSAGTSRGQSTYSSSSAQYAMSKVVGKGVRTTSAHSTCRSNPGLVRRSTEILD